MGAPGAVATGCTVKTSFAESRGPVLPGRSSETARQEHHAIMLSVPTRGAWWANRWRSTLLCNSRARILRPLVCVPELMRDQWWTEGRRVTIDARIQAHITLGSHLLLPTPSIGSRRRRHSPVIYPWSSPRAIIAGHRRRRHRNG